MHTLLADALIGDPADGWLGGTRPDPRVVAAAKDGPVDPAADVAEGVFQMWNRSALRPDGTLPDPLSATDHWVWNEGVPADIEARDGRRVVLLGPTAYARTWSAGRMFGAMLGSVDRVAKLGPTT